MENAVARLTDDPARVMIVDDSPMMRNLIANYLRSENCIVTTAANGAEAVENLKNDKAEIILLDIEMPVMDGLTAIPLLKQIDPCVQIVMASTLSQRNAAISLRALELGAADYIPKPVAGNVSEGGGFRPLLLEKVRELAKTARRPRTAGVTIAKSSLALRPLPTQPPQLIAIACSTGGPQALKTLVSSLSGVALPPVLITQHMPAFFTASLAQNIANNCKVDCAEARDGQTLHFGRFYIAPGDYHLRVGGNPLTPSISLGQEEPENFCRPSADPMLRSVAAFYGTRALAIILTGMGQDGCAGCRAIVKNGGAVLAQDEASSAVWGMPGAVANAGLCSAILPLPDMAALVTQLVRGTK